MTSKREFDILNKFYPEEYFNIIDVEEREKAIIIKLKAVTNSCYCPRCQSICRDYHGTYVRKVKDLPILGKSVTLEITSHEYRCNNDECDTVTVSEAYDGFLNQYSR